jgi:predicted dithiol-disulfide oxidoreductase (DUF899 family)
LFSYFSRQIIDLTSHEGGKIMEPKRAPEKSQTPRVVGHDDWLHARVEFLRKEKEFTHLREDLARQRRELPWELVEKNYTFESPRGPVSLAELFDGRSQLLVYHFMLGPDWKEGCPGCSFVSDHIDGAIPHIHARDITLVAVSRAPLSQIAPFKQRMGWRFPWVSSNAGDFNFDYGVSFTKEEIAAGKNRYNYGSQALPGEEGPGLSAFYKDAAGNIFHTYSTYARGLDPLLGAYQFIDLAPLGRNEGALNSAMSWVRHHDRY